MKEKIILQQNNFTSKIIYARNLKWCTKKATKRGINKAEEATGDLVGN